MEKHESKGNGFDLELILSKTPSEEIRNEMIVDAVQRRITNNPEYFKKAVETLESKNNYQAIAFLYGADERSPFYDSGKSVEYFTKAAQLYGFKKDVKSKIGTGAVLKEMGRKTFNGVRETLKFLCGGFIFPTLYRKQLKSLKKDSPCYFSEKEGRTSDIGVSACFSILATVLGPALAYNIPTGDKEIRPINYIPFAVWMGTNVASGLYEWYRDERNKMEEKAKKGLETELENTPLSNMSIDLAPDTGIRTHYKEQMEDEYERKINSEKRKVSE